MSTPRVSRSARPPQTINGFALLITALYAAATVLIIGIANLPCRQLVVWSSDEKFTLLRDIANDYRAPSVDRRCVSIVIKQVNSGEAENALSTDATIDGTRAHVWAPAAETWALLLKEHRRQAGKSDIVPAVRPSLMQSPLVIAMPESMADALRDCQFEIGWRDILQLVEDPRKCAGYSQRWGKFRLAKTNPTISTSGLHALLTTYSAAVDRTGPLTLDDVRRSDVRDFVRRVEGSVVHYARTVRTFLATLYSEDEKGAALNYASAIATEEKQVYDYNRGNPSSAPCAICNLPPREKLKAVYPTGGTLFANHPYIVLDAPWVNDVDREAAQLFLDHLGTKQNQARFLDAGFRDQAGHGDRKVLREPYFDLNQPRSEVTLSEPQVLTEMQSSWDTLRKPANVILLYDIGTSMSRRTAELPGTKRDLLASATRQALKAGLRPDRDAVGLWTFPSATSRSPFDEITPIQLLNTGELDRSLGALATVSGDRRLFLATRAAVDHLRSRFASDKVNAVVVVSDGDDADPTGQERDRLLTYLRGQAEDERIRVFTIPYDPRAADALGKIAHASKGFAYDAENLDLEKILRDVISDF